MEKHRAGRRISRTGADVRRMRNAFYVHQSDLASAIGCSQPFLSQVENGARLIAPSRFAQIQNALREIARRRAEELNALASQEVSA